MNCFIPYLLSTMKNMKQYLYLSFEKIYNKFDVYFYKYLQI
jgi:hypothetical protein